MSKKNKSSRAKDDSSSESESEPDSDNSDHPVILRKSKSKTTKPKSKNPPGRPRKNPQIPAPKVNGIVKSPDDPDNIFELLYYKPSSMKKVVHLIKGIGASKIQILVQSDKLIFFTQDKYRTNSSMIVLHGNKMNQFYHKTDLDIGISSENFIAVCEIINKRHSCFAMTQSVDMAKESIDIIFHNGHTGIRTTKTIHLSKKWPKLTPELQAEFMQQDALIRFEYPSYDFKRLISAGKGVGSIRFRQNGGKRPLIVEIEQHKGQIKSKDVFDPQDIKVAFSSKVPDDDIFTISASTDALRAISSSALGQNVEVFLSEKSPVRTKISVDDGNIVVYTLTKLAERKVKPVIKQKKKKRNASDNSESDSGSDSEHNNESGSGSEADTNQLTKPKIIKVSAFKKAASSDEDSGQDEDEDEDEDKDGDDPVDELSGSDSDQVVNANARKKR